MTQETTYENGLYLGKFAPLHNGHQYVIETALEEVDHLFVIIYDCPDVTNVPLSVRADWIRHLYPENVTVIEGWTMPTESGYSEEIKRRHENAIKNVLEEPVDAFYSSEPYGEHVSNALNADDRRVDPERNTVPISATKIRNSTYQNREYVEDVVYQDLITKVAFLGGPSTGKSTITKAVADEYNTEYMYEYGREYWEKHNVDRRLTKEQLLEIAVTHRQKEDKRIQDAREIFFTDTNAITTYLFSKYYHGEALPKLKRLAKECAFRYDMTFVCGTDIPYDNTEDRSGEVNRERLQKMTLAFLNRHNIQYKIITGDVPERVQQVEDTLLDFNRYDFKLN